MQHTLPQVGYFERNGSSVFPRDANAADVMLDEVAPAGSEAKFDWSADK